MAADRMSWSSESSLSELEETELMSSDTQLSSVEDGLVLEQGTESKLVDPVLPGEREKVCCCWVDISQRGVSQERFERLFLNYPQRSYKTRVLCCVNSCILYGVWVDGEQDPCGDTRVLEHDFPNWVEFVYPRDGEKKGLFFERLEGQFFRIQLETLCGVSM